MNQLIASEILNEQIAELRTISYAALSSRIETTDVRKVIGRDGTTYKIEINYFWDGRKGGEVRVIASIDDGGSSAFVPLTDDFIKAADETFVGE